MASAISMKKFKLNSSSMILILLLLLSSLNIIIVLVSSMPSGVSDSFLTGNKISCNEEGQIVVIPFLRSDPCIKCMCLNGEIDCFKNACPQAMNCYHYQSNQSDSCCPQTCLSCKFGDRIVNNNEYAQDSDDVCKSHFCNSGTLTSHETICHVPCDKPIRLLGQCCPSCNACPKNAKDGEEVDIINNVEDPCIRCYCFKGQMICHRKVCPVLPCHRSQWYKPKNYCCPICKGNKVLDSDLFQGKCLIGDKVYQHMDRFVFDECTTCVCQNSTNICQRKACAKLSCPESEQIKTENQCCPKCQSPRVKKGMSLDCFHQNRLLKDGEWVDSCRQCKCNQGKIECSNRMCPNDFVCPHGHRKAKINGECCESCVPEDGHCILKDSSTNITTFDGKNYHWTGQCNYVLAKDCELKRFSIHLLHKFHNSSTHSRPIYRGASLLVRIENSRILLSHMGRIRVNRTLVQLPYIQMGRFSIVQTQDRVKLHAIIGVDILWQKNGSIDLKIKSHFRDQTCGLCGNFNLDPNDEFKAKRLKSIVELDRFVNSYKVGQNILCPKSMIKQSTSKTSLSSSLVLLKDDLIEKTTKFCQNQGEQAILSAVRVCNRMRQRHGPCIVGDGNKNELPEEKIHEQCLKDMCTCRGDKQCQCYTVERFIKDCTRDKNINVPETSMCKSFQCPIGSEFKFCSHQCRKTCQNRKQRLEQLKLQRQCRRKECKSGCECIGNRVWYKGQCIPEVMCP